MYEARKKKNNFIRYIIFFQILEPAFFAPRDIVIGLSKDPAQLMTYRSFIKSVANIFIDNQGSYVDEATLDQETLDVANFEIELAKVLLSSRCIKILIFRLILFSFLRFLFVFSSISS